MCEIENAFTGTSNTANTYTCTFTVLRVESNFEKLACSHVRDVLFRIRKAIFFEFSEHDREVPFCCKYLLLYWDSSVVFCQFRLFQHSYFYWRLEPYLSHVVYFTLNIRCEMPNYLFFGGLLRRNGPFSVVSRLSNQSLCTQFTVKWHTSGVELIFQYHWLNRKKLFFHLAWFRLLETLEM